MDNNNDETWIEYRRLVLSNLQRLEQEVKEVNAKSDIIKMELAMLKTKMGVWSALVAFIVTSIVLPILLHFLKLK